MENKNNVLLEVDHLVVQYETNVGTVEAVNDVSFALGKGETLGLVGETGAGKTTHDESHGGCVVDRPFCFEDR